MHSIEVACPSYGMIRFIGDGLHAGHDFLLDANCSRAELEVLVFMDSRGVCGGYSGSLIERMLHLLNAKRRYLAICRPLELTTWATLYNFITLNDIRPPKLITNVGFVDFTPKKESVLADAVRQVEALMGPGVVQTKFVEQFVGESGQSMPISSMTYGDGYREHIQSVLRESATVVINTPLVTPDACGARRRPNSFFAGIRSSNSFNRSICGVDTIDIPEFDRTQTYDGVHYTQRGNELIFELVKNFL